MQPPWNVREVQRLVDRAGYNPVLFHLPVNEQKPSFLYNLMEICAFPME